MRYIMRILFVLFIVAIVYYTLNFDLFGPLIKINDGMSLEFALYSAEPDWTDYIYAVDGKDGKIDSDDLIFYDSAINFNNPGTQHMTVEAMDSKGNMSERTFDVYVQSGYTSIDFESLTDGSLVTSDMVLQDVKNSPLYSSYGLVDSTSDSTANTSIERHGGSKSLKVDFKENYGGAENNGVYMPINLIHGDEYYFSYKMHITSAVKNELVLPTISTNYCKKDTTCILDNNPVNITVGEDGKLKVKFNTKSNKKEYVIDNFNVIGKPVNVLMHYDLGGKEKSGSFELWLNDKLVLSVQDINYGNIQFNVLLLQMYYKDSIDNEYPSTYIDNIKASMVEDDIKVE